MSDTNYKDPVTENDTVTHLRLTVNDLQGSTQQFSEVTVLTSTFVSANEDEPQLTFTSALRNTSGMTLPLDHIVVPDPSSASGNYTEITIDLFCDAYDNTLVADGGFARFTVSTSNDFDPAGDVVYIGYIRIPPGSGTAAASQRHLGSVSFKQKFVADQQLYFQMFNNEFSSTGTQVVVTARTIGTV